MPKPKDQPDPEEPKGQDAPEVDPSTLEALEGGAPEGEPGEPAAQPKLIEVSIEGSKFAVPEDVARALEERERGFQRKLSEQGSELGELRKFRQGMATRMGLADDGGVEKEPPISELIFSEPERFVESLEQRIVGKLTSAYTADKNQEKFWGDFYRDNPELSKAPKVVEATLRDNWASLSGMTPPEASAKLADLSRAELLRLTELIRPAGGEREVPGRGRAVVERGGGGASAALGEPEGPNSLSEVVRTRRRARRARAGAGGG
ncbi:MAG: hypothetical protein ACE5JJ_07540 [Nitrospinota bacterium]